MLTGGSPMAMAMDPWPDLPADHPAAPAPQAADATTGGSISLHFWVI